MFDSLLRCGRCGKRLFVRYHGSNGTHKRYHCGTKPIGESSCISFGGLRVDEAVSESVLKLLSDVGLEASLKAIAKINTKRFRKKKKSLKFLRQRKGKR